MERPYLLPKTNECAYLTSMGIAIYSVSHSWKDTQVLDFKE